MAESKFYRMIEWIYAIFVIGVLVVITVLDNNWYYIYKNDCKVPNIVFLVIFVIVAGIIVFARMSYIESHKEIPQPAPMKLQDSMKMIGYLSIVLFLFQLFYAVAIWFETGWDCRELVTAAQDMALNGTPIGDSHYFSIYPNNVFLTGIFAGIIKGVSMCGIPAAYFPLIAIGCALVSATGYFFADCIRVLTARKSLMYLSWILYVILTGLSPWISIPYSDTYSIFFPTFCIWLYLTKDDKNYLPTWFSITVAAFVGYFIKPTVLLTFIVLFFFQIVHGASIRKSVPKMVRYKHTIGFLLTVLLGVTVAYAMKFGMEKITGFTPDENKHFTAAHYLMMGANYEYGGGYNQTDVNASASYATVAERNAGDIKEAARRIGEMFPFKLVKFASQKCLTNFNDGTYAWGNEGAFYWEYYERNDGFSKFVRSFIYHIGDRHDIWVAFCQAFWYVNLCFCALLCLKGRRHKNYKETAILTLMLAIMCFLMVFEARARYLYLYSPIIYMCGALGLNRLLLGKDAK